MASANIYQHILMIDNNIYDLVGKISKCFDFRGKLMMFTLRGIFEGRDLL